MCTLSQVAESGGTLQLVVLKGTPPGTCTSERAHVRTHLKKKPESEVCNYIQKRTNIKLFKKAENQVAVKQADRQASRILKMRSSKPKIFRIPVF